MTIGTFEAGWKRDGTIYLVIKRDGPPSQAGSLIRVDPERHKDLFAKLADFLIEKGNHPKSN